MYIDNNLNCLCINKNLFAMMLFHMFLQISVTNLSGKKSKEIEPKQTKVTIEELDNNQECELQNVSLYLLK